MVKSVEEVRLVDLKNDYGASCGSYAFEEEAFKRFEKAAKADGLYYELDEEEMEQRKGLYIVEI